MGSYYDGSDCISNPSEVTMPDPEAVHNTLASREPTPYYRLNPPLSFNCDPDDAGNIDNLIAAPKEYLGASSMFKEMCLNLLAKSLYMECNLESDMTIPLFPGDKAHLEVKSRSPNLFSTVKKGSTLFTNDLHIQFSIIYDSQVGSKFNQPLVEISEGSNPYLVGTYTWEVGVGSCHIHVSVIDEASSVSHLLSPNFPVGVPIQFPFGGPSPKFPIGGSPIVIETARPGNPLSKLKAFEITSEEVRTCCIEITSHMDPLDALDFHLVRPCPTPVPDLNKRLSQLGLKVSMEGQTTSLKGSASSLQSPPLSLEAAFTLCAWSNQDFGTYASKCALQWLHKTFSPKHVGNWRWTKPSEVPPLYLLAGLCHVWNFRVVLVSYCNVPYIFDLKPPSPPIGCQSGIVLSVHAFSSIAQLGLTSWVRLFEMLLVGQLEAHPGLEAWPGVTPQLWAGVERGDLRPLPSDPVVPTTGTTTATNTEPTPYETEVDAAAARVNPSSSITESPRPPPATPSPPPTWDDEVDGELTAAELELREFVKSNGVSQSTFLVLKQAGTDKASLETLAADNSLDDIPGLNQDQQNELKLRLPKQQNLTQKPVSSWTVDDVANWLKEKEFSDFCPIFEKNGINGSGLLVLLRTDLSTMTASIPLSRTMRLYPLIVTLRGTSQEAKFPTTRNTELTDAQLGLIRIGFSEPFLPSLDCANWFSFFRQASKTDYVPVISFIGDTGSGKSHLTNELLSFTSRRDHKGPIIASHDQQQSTTGNIHLFRGELSTGQPILLMDVEGEKGGIPKAMQGVVHTFMCSSQIYALADVVVYISREAIQNKGYSERVLQFASKMADQDVVGHKPHLVLIQNFCPDVRPIPADWDITKSTEDFKASLFADSITGNLDQGNYVLSYSQTGDPSTCEVWNKLHECFSSVSFVRLPNG
ncbi:hypothetical protein Pelo_16997 [Pelomyxa schiedti]|nr:hypothetical protein Pelo_16997 [Pelomyxa schiedti]